MIPLLSTGEGLLICVLLVMALLIMLGEAV